MVPPPAHAPHRAAVRGGSAIRAGRARDDHQRQEVLFARVRAAGGGSARPLGEAAVAIPRVERGGLAQPGVERLGHGARPRIAEAAHVVVAHPAADDEDALVAERRQRAADGQVLLRVEAPLERELHRRNVGVRVGQLERDERPVIEPALRVARGGVPRRAEELLCSPGELGMTGRRPGDGVRLGREAVIVGEDGRPFGARHGRHRLLPVRRDHEQRLRRGLRERAHAAEIAGEILLVGLVEPEVDERPRTAAVREERDRHATAAARARANAVHAWTRGFLVRLGVGPRRRRGAAAAWERGERRRREPSCERAAPRQPLIVLFAHGLGSVLSSHHPTRHRQYGLVERSSLAAAGGRLCCAASTNGWRRREPRSVALARRSM